MKRSMRRRQFAVVGIGIALFGIASVLASRNAISSAAAQPKPLETPPEGQTFIGSKQCGSCHFDQLLQWKQTKHAKGFEILPAKYKKDADCLKCHTTGFGEATGYVDAKTPDLVGTTCEACHGPGSEHGKIAKTFGDKKLSEAEEAYVRSTIYKMQPKNVCVECHLAQTHKKHPDYEGKK